MSAGECSVEEHETEEPGSTGDAEAILRVSDLNVTIDGQKIIEDLSFTVKQGDILTVLGPNGAGKTVLLRALIGVLPYEGTICSRSGGPMPYEPHNEIRKIQIAADKGAMHGRC